MFAAYNLLHLSYWVSSASNYVVGSIVSYFLNKYLPSKIKKILEATGNVRDKYYNMLSVGIWDGKAGCVMDPS